MDQYGPATYGDRIAEFYDEQHAALAIDHPMIEERLTAAVERRCLPLRAP